jgi:hypothetical protein
MLLSEGLLEFDGEFQSIAQDRFISMEFGAMNTVRNTGESVLELLKFLIRT